MHYFIQKKKGWHRGIRCFFFLVFILFLGATVSCANEKEVSKKSNVSTNGSEKKELRDATPVVLSPEATGAVTYQEENVSIDASNVSEGYIMLNYTGTNEKVKFQIKTPEGIEYTYPVTNTGQYNVYSLSGGNGTYQYVLLESVSVENNQYAVVFSKQQDVTISNEFSPFLYPNYYVNFSIESQAVKMAQKLAEGCTSDLEVVSNVYNYVIENIEYDTKKAENVPYGYTPDVDATLKSGKGICFDYAALMSAMLRSQRIPVRLEVGYVGEIYHAWISCYIEDVGWVDDIIEFDGKNWSLMDPTLAANNDKDSTKEYIGDKSRYIVKYSY